ncbi:MAG TPA: competence/damage-inducible protein A [Gemmatimonadales bacterium]|nr:competence/damage-inducible protein A [Gemmatimonadales bacterium]
MNVEVITVGTELLLGFIVNGNAAVMGQLLADAGFRAQRCVSVPDSAALVREAVAGALERSRAVLVSGGLGPTRDDITRPAVAELLGRPLRRDPAIVERLESFFRSRGMARMPEGNLAQADVPEGATVIPNPLGTAPGLWIEDAGRVVVLMPGVPKELRRMMKEEVLPRLVEWEQRREDGKPGAERPVIRSRTLRTTGIGESALAEKVGDPEKLLDPGVSLAFLPTTSGTDLRITAWDLAPGAADAALERAAATLRGRIGPYLYGEGEADLAAVVLELLEGQGARLAVAESCTGGAISARLTAVPGCSRVLVGGIVAYDDELKLGWLGVSADVLAAHGAVSEPVARQMAAGIARALGAEAGIGVTGIAGPDGGSDEKPVGTVWIAIRWREHERAFRHVFPGDREDVRARAAQWALDYLRRVVSGSV